MESFHKNPDIGEVPPPISIQARTRKEGVRWDKTGKVARLRGNVRREARTAELIESTLKEDFPNVLIKTHPQPRKKR